jgi:AraC-like DNA-binding protein
MLRLCLLPLFLLLLPFSGTARKLHEGLEIRRYPWHMHTLNYPPTPGGDSVVVSKYDEVWYFNLDTICYYMATDRYSVRTIDLMHLYYQEVMDFTSEKQIEEGYLKMKAAAKKYNSRFIDHDADYMKIHFEFYNRLHAGTMTEETFNDFTDRIHYHIQERGDKDRVMQIILRKESYDMSRDFQNYARMFKYIPQIDGLLENIQPEEYYDYYYVYFFMGYDYLCFNDFERAVPLLKKALHDKPTHFADRSDLRARTFLADYYAGINQLDSSDYYYRSIYDDRNLVRFRPIYDMIAATGIACNMVRRGNYSEALPVLQRWLPEAQRENRTNDIFKIYLAQGECFLAENRTAQTLATIDSIHNLMRQYPKFNFRKEKLFDLMYRYHSALGDVKQAQRYVDSMQTAIDSRLKATSALIILRAEQETFETEKELRDKQIEMHKTRNLFAFGGCLLLAVTLGIWIYYSRRIVRKNRELVRKNQLWANVVPVSAANTANTVDTADTAGAEPEDTPPEDSGEKTAPTLPDVMDRVIMGEIEKLIAGGLYKDSNLSLDMLAEKTGYIQNYISKAINRCTGKHFKAYVNEYRIKEAKRILSDTCSTNISIDRLAFESGFNDRTIFYRVFKKTTGLSPSDFKKNALKS